MPVTLNLNPDVEQGLTALAEERGMFLSTYLEEIAAREAARFPTPARASGEETAAAFLRWADSFPDSPLLSEEAISRDNLYPDRL